MQVIFIHIPSPINQSLYLSEAQGNKPKESVNALESLPQLGCDRSQVVGLTANQVTFSREGA